MEQVNKLVSTLDKLLLIQNESIEVRFNNRRTIRFRCPTISEVTSELDIRTFIALISLTPEKIKEEKIKLNFAAEDPGSIIQGFIFEESYIEVLPKYFLRFIENSVYKDKAIFVNNEKLMSYELNFIINTMLISLGRKDFDEEKNEKEQEEIEKTNPMMAKILAAQKVAEEKLKKVKAQKNKNSLTVEEIMLAVKYEFGISFAEMKNMNYYGLIWIFNYVGKVDAHKLNQMILSSGMSKQKNYSYWLNK